jgi:hypothetical protein
MKQLFRDIRWVVEEIALGTRDAFALIVRKDVAMFILIAIAIYVLYTV